MDDPTPEQLLEQFELEYAFALQRAAESRIEIAALEARTGEPLTEASSTRATHALALDLWRIGRADLARVLLDARDAVVTGLDALKAHCKACERSGASGDLRRTLDLWDALMTAIDEKDRVCADVLAALQGTDR
ncbi:MAG: hypothetical protein IT177_07770 [Acidobacteria bacterium]|nr:hypothetical protein [Acidobacteriota bacterium]